LTKCKNTHPPLFVENAGHSDLIKKLKLKVYWDKLSEFVNKGNIVEIIEIENKEIILHSFGSSTEDIFTEQKEEEIKTIEIENKF
jgi:hypothetical protein